MPAPLEWRPARIAAVTDLTPDIRALEIAPEGDCPPAASGAHLKVSLLLNGRPDTRSYSIVETTPRGYEIAVKRLSASRGGSAYMHGLAPGARLDIAGPHNHFALNLAAPECLLVAGGIGVTPLYAHALALAPETATSCHYFWNFVRTFKRDDEGLTHALQSAHVNDGQGVYDQDHRILEAQQRAILENPRQPFYNLNIDAGALWARRLIDDLVARERPRAVAE